MEDKNKSKIVDLQMVKGTNKPSHTKFAQFQPNEELIQATSRIKTQRDTILDRIKKMEDASERVTKSVYDKVKRDYSLQLQTITELLDEKKELLSKEIKDLYVRREKLSVEVNRHKEILEEAEFRNFLGEFSQSQYQEVENFETKEIEKLENDLAKISEYIRAHEDLFDPHDLGSKKNSSEQPKPAPKTTTPEVTKTAASPAPSVKQTTAAPQASAPQEQPQQPIPSPAVQEDVPVTEINEEISDEDFEALFTSEDDGKKPNDASQSAIQNLLDDSASESSGNIEIATKPDSDDTNYFKQDKNLEDSFTVKKQPKTNEDQITSDEDTPDHIEATREQNKTKTDTSVESEAPAPVAPKQDDSISDILESIQLDDADQADQPLSVEVEAEAKPQTDQPMLTLVEGEHEQTEFLVKDNTSIGRSPSNDVVLKAPKVSRQHAAINRYNDQYILIDLKSSNGVYVNGAKVDEAVLNAGDEVSVGGYKFIFSKS